MNAGTSADQRAEATLWPKHHQVYLVLRQQIMDGIWAAEEAMPAELQLAERFGVSRITIRRAMDRLSAEGVIERARGRGTFVRPVTGQSPVSASLSGNFENLMALGLETTVTVIAHEMVVPGLDVAAALGLSPGAKARRTVRVRSLDARPFSHLTTWLPEDIGAAITEADLEQRSLLRLIEATGHPVQSARQTISACLATPEVARLLRIEAGEALLAIRRTVFDVEGRAVERIHGLYRPDTYEHEMSFERSARGADRVWNT